MQKFDLAIAYKWIYDEELVHDIENKFQSSGLTTFIIHKGIIQQILDKVQDKDIEFRCFLDRATDEDENFEPLAEAIINSGSRIINHHHLIDSAIDKAEILPKLIEKNILVPDTMILPPYEVQEEINLNISDIEKLGKPFVTKPAYYTGGGESTNVNCFSLEDIQNQRKELYDDRYLIQKKIESKYIDGYKAWFRAFFLFDEVMVVQWDDDKKIYDKIPFRNLPNVDYDIIIDITKSIAQICKLNYFSTEITIGNDGKYYTIDFVNDPCDFRKQSKHYDGVPDIIVDKFIEKLMEFVKN